MAVRENKYTVEKRMNYTVKTQIFLTDKSTYSGKRLSGHKNRGWTFVIASN